MGGDSWLEEVGKALEGGRGESLGCTAAAPAEEVVAFSATLDAPEYPPERGEEMKCKLFVVYEAILSKR